MTPPDLTPDQLEACRRTGMDPERYAALAGQKVLTLPEIQRRLSTLAEQQQQRADDALVLEAARRMRVADHQADQQMRDEAVERLAAEQRRAAELRAELAKYENRETPDAA